MDEVKTHYKDSPGDNELVEEAQLLILIGKLGGLALNEVAQELNEHHKEVGVYCYL